MNKPEELKNYPVLGPIRKDGIMYKPDPSKEVSISLTDREAAELRQAGAIGEAVAADETKPKSKTK